MILEPRPGRYRLHRPGSPEAEAVLAEQGLTHADLERALAELERSEGTRIRTIIGINDDGVFGSRRADWRADHPHACAEPFVPLLWLKVQELLGRVPEGSTARFIKTARCWTRPRAAPPITGWPAEASTRSTNRHRLYAAVASRPAAICRP